MICPKHFKLSPHCNNNSSIVRAWSTVSYTLIEQLKAIMLLNLDAHLSNQLTGNLHIKIMQNLC